MNMTTFYLKTLGCKVNQYESQVIREQFLNRGFREVGSDGSPDVCIVNTCSVTSRAQAKGRNCINHLRRQYPDTTLVVTGCTVSYQPESIDGKADILITNQEKLSLVNIFTPLETESLTGFSDGERNFDYSGITHFTGRTRAFVKIQDGCNEFCSYCILPYVRGRSRSREFNKVINEVIRLVNNGYREIVLTGIHLGDYGKDKGKQDELVELLKRLEKIPQLVRIRLSSLEPQDITEQLINKVACSDKICRHFHIPLQSGDNLILKRMNRRCNYEEYKSLLDTITARIPEVFFTTDIIVGFPGETDSQFLCSCKAVEEIGFVKVHIFPYSVRPGTAAVRFKNRVSDSDIKSRLKTLKKVSEGTASKVKGKLLGSTQEVLVEKSGMNSMEYTHTPKSLVRGYTSGYIPALVSGVGDSNTLVKVRITGTDGQYLAGERI